MIIHALNEWMHEHWSYVFADALFSTPIISLARMDKAIEELELIHERGARNVPWSYGVLGKIVVSPAYHRLHHSVAGPPGTNLGIVLTIWDVLASRAVFPVPKAPVPATGLAGRPVPVEQSPLHARPGRRMVEQLTEPFTVAPRRQG